jgi:hypothetical protein
METALHDWCGARQDEAMTEHFSGTDLVDPEWQSWRTLRRTAASSKLKRTAR